MKQAIKTEVGEFKERPILFKGSMVKAILEGRKVQTRRLVKLPQCEFPYGCYGVKDGKFLFGEGDYPEDGTFPIKPPFGMPGDWLWIRETWQISELWTEPDTECIGYRADGEIRECNEHREQIYDPLRFRLHAKDPDNGDSNYCPKWRTPIFMPRWASRIDLIVTGVKVERVQRIDEYDAYQEGVESVSPYGTYREGFKYLWDSINAKRGFSWDSNPLVWVIQFEVKGGSSGN